MDAFESRISTLLVQQLRNMADFISGCQSVPEAVKLLETTADELTLSYIEDVTQEALGGPLEGLAQ